LVVILLFYVCYLKTRRARRHAAEVAGNPVPQPEAFIKPEFDNTSFLAACIFEAEGMKVIPAVEIGYRDVQWIYKLPAREEAAAEINGLSEPRMAE